MPAGCLYAPQTFIDKNPNTVQALANAIVRADKWIQAAGAGDIIKAVPESYLLGDRAVYIDAFLAAKGALSPDGMIPEEGAETARRALASIDPEIAKRQDRPRRGLHQRLREEGEREVPEGDERRQRPQPSPRSALAGRHLHLRRARTTPGQRYTAVRDVTLTVGAGEFVSVVGPTGCGKSTLLNVAAGLLAPSSGSVARVRRAARGHQPPRRLHVPDREPDAVAHRAAAT